MYDDARYRGKKDAGDVVNSISAFGINDDGLFLVLLSGVALFLCLFLTQHTEGIVLSVQCRCLGVF